MKRKNILFGIILFIMFFFNPYLNADCKSAKEEADSLLYYIDLPRFDKLETSLIVILESTQINIEVSNNYDTTINKYGNNSDEKTFVVTEVSPNIYKNITYDINVFYTDKTCGTESIATYSIDTGIYNKYNESSYCINSDVYIDRCSESYTTEQIKKYGNLENMTEEEFNKLAEEDVKNGTNIPDDRTTKEKVIDFVKNNYLYVLLPLIIVSIIYITIIIIAKRKKVQNEQK